MKIKNLLILILGAVVLASFCSVGNTCVDNSGNDEEAIPANDGENDMEAASAAEETEEEWNGFRVTKVYRYKGGVLASIYNPDDKSTTEFDKGNAVITYLNGDRSNFTFKAEYGADGVIKKSWNENGDVSSYDGNGRLVSKTHTDGDGNTAVVEKNFVYDEYGRLKSADRKVADESGESWEKTLYEYDGQEMKTATTYGLNENGKIAGDPKSVTHFMYEIDKKSGKAKTSVTEYADGSKMVNYEYLATGRKEGIKYAAEGGATDLYTYNENNLLDSVYDITDGGHKLKTTYVYDPSNCARVEATITVDQYDDAGNPAKITVTAYDDYGNALKDYEVAGIKGLKALEEELGYSEGFLKKALNKDLKNNIIPEELEE
ncbi:hypothetical protein ACFLTD_04095 [Elusimicrobiota bacterium]